MRTMSRARVAGVLMMGVLVPMWGCTTNPTTGKSQFNMLSREQEIQIGTENTPAMVQEHGGVVANADLQAYVREIGMKLVAHTEGDNPTLPWEFTLLDSDIINAFAMPGGKVFITRGLAVKMSNEAQLAGVLGHEIGHVTARHINDAIARQAGYQGIGAVLGIGLGNSAASSALLQLYGAGGQGVLLKFGRDQESESDALGMRYMSKAGYNPLGQRQVMGILAEASAGGGGSWEEFLATHPYPETRIKRIDGLLEREYAHTQNNPAYTLGEEAFRNRFLSKLTAAFPEGRAFNEHDHRLALAGVRMGGFVNCRR